MSTRRSQRLAKETRKEPRKSRKPKTAPAPQLLPPPIATMSLDALREALHADVMHQVDPVHLVASEVMQAWIHHIRWTPPEPGERRVPAIFKCLLTGPSGCGKTETVNRVKHYLGMEKGYAYSHCTAFLDGSTCLDTTAVTRVTGASAGYKGCDDHASLPEQLCTALETDSDRLALMRMEPNSPEYREKKALIELREKRGELKPTPAPPVILVFVDEIDKAIPAMMMALNGLLDTGCMAAARGLAFTLPAQTALLFMFTANWGEVEVARQPVYAMESDLRQLTVRAIERCGVHNCTLGRMGRPLVYRALSPTQLGQVVLCKLDAFLRSSKQPPIECDDEVRHFLVQRVVKEADLARGVRSGVAELMGTLNELFVDAFHVLRQHARPAWDQPIRISKAVCEEAGAEVDAVIQHAMKSQRGKTAVQNYRQVRESNPERDRDNGMITALAMTHETQLLSACVLPPLLMALADCAQESDDRHADILKRHRELKDTVNDMMDVVSATDCDATERCERVLALGRSKSELLSMDDEPLDPLARRVERRLAGDPPLLKRARTEALTNRVEEVVEEPVVADGFTQGMDVDGPHQRQCVKCKEVRPLEKFPIIKKKGVVKTLKTGEICRRNRCTKCH